MNKPAQPEVELYTVAEAARRLALSPASIRRKIRRGELLAVLLGDGPGAPLRIPADELGRYAFSRPARGSRAPAWAYLLRTGAKQEPVVGTCEQP